MPALQTRTARAAPVVQTLENNLLTANAALRLLLKAANALTANVQAKRSKAALIVLAARTLSLRHVSVFALTEKQQD